MRILVVTQYFYPENFRINDICTSLKERGHEVTVLTGLPNYPQGKLYQGYGFFKGPFKEELNGIPIYRVPLIPRGNGHSIMLVLNYFAFMLIASVLAPFKLWGKKFDSIFVYQPSPVTVVVPAIVLRFFKKIPIYFWVTDLWPETLKATGVVKGKFSLWLWGKFVERLYSYCHRILVTSKGFIPKIQARGVSSKKIFYWPQWGEDMFLDYQLGKYSIKHPIDPLPEGFKIMFAGNIGSSQSFDTILAAAFELKSYQEIKWVILGNGVERDWVARQIKEKGLENQFFLMGSKPLETMPAYYEKADILLASLKRDPVFAITVPSKIQSYLPSGKPIIASMDGEGAELVEHAGAGIGCAASDPLQLKEGVLKLYQMKESERVEMGRRGKEYFIKNFTRQNLLDQLESIIGSSGNAQ